MDAPLFWSSEELAELAGTQLLANAAGYDSYVRGTHAALKETTFKEHPALFGDAGDDDGGGAFSEREFLWAFGVLRSRALPPVDQGESIALIPGIDMANHDGLCSQTWQLNNGGIAAVFGGRGGADGGGSVLLRVEKTKAGGAKRGEEIRCNYGPANIDSQFALDYGFVDAFCSRPGYVLGPLSIPEDDVNAFDKMDVLSVAGLKESPAFTIRAFEDPPPEMVVFMRLLNLKNDDAFLLEAIFRQECWALISDPVSRDNEADACVTMLRRVLITPVPIRPRRRGERRYLRTFACALSVALVRSNVHVIKLLTNHITSRHIAHQSNAPQRVRGSIGCVRHEDRGRPRRRGRRRRVPATAARRARAHGGEAGARGGAGVLRVGRGAAGSDGVLPGAATAESQLARSRRELDVRSVSGHDGVTRRDATRRERRRRRRGEVVMKTMRCMPRRRAAFVRSFVRSFVGTQRRSSPVRVS